MINQNSQFLAILTNVGVAKQANADALGVPWKITQMGVGDANDTDPVPSATQTRLINEKRRAPLNQLKVDPTNAAIIVAEQVIPAEVGGWWIREIGLYDADGDLVAIANCAPSFKPLLTQGSGRTQVVRINLLVSNSSNVELKIDPSVVLATRAYVDSKFSTVIEVYAQASAYDGTPGKLLKVGAFGWGSSYSNGPFLFSNMTGDQTIFSGLYRYSPETIGHPEFGSGYGSILQSSLSNQGGNWATQLAIDYAADSIGFRRLSGPAGWQPFLEIWHRGNLKAATQDQTNSGVDDTTFVTPKKFAAGVAALVIQATEAIKGIARVATQSETNSGVDDTTFVTPKKFSAGIAALVIQATESIKGIAQVATQGDLTTGTDDSRFVTAKKLTSWLASKAASYTAAGIAAFASATELAAGTSETKMLNPAVARYGFSILKAQNGYVVFPGWLGGFIIQWGTATIAGALTNIPYPLSYPSTAIVTLGTAQNVSGGLDGVELSLNTNTYFSAVVVSANTSATQSPGTFGWISLGW